MKKKSVGQENESNVPVSDKNAAKLLNKSAEGARRVRKNVSFKDSFSNLLSIKAPSGALNEAVKSSPLGENINYQEAILLAQIIKAINGDTQAAVFVRDTSGNKIKEAEVKETKRKKFEDF